MADNAALVGVLLAAGRATRMQGASKVLAAFDGEPLVRRIASRMLNSHCSSVVVVTGHERERVEQALEGLPVTLLHNRDYANGMGTSIACAAAHIEGNAIMLAFADMPKLTTAHFDAVIDGWAAAGGDAIVRGANNGEPGHPIIFPKYHLPQLRHLTGDRGAKGLVANARLIEIGAAATLDVDTPQAVMEAGGMPD